LEFFLNRAIPLPPAPGDQLLQNSPRAETQQGYVVERCVWRFFYSSDTPFAVGGLEIFSKKKFPAPLPQTECTGTDANASVNFLGLSLAVQLSGALSFKPETL